MSDIFSSNGKCGKTLSKTLQQFTIDEVGLRYSRYLTLGLMIRNQT